MFWEAILARRQSRTADCGLAALSFEHGSWPTDYRARNAVGGAGHGRRRNAVRVLPGGPVALGIHAGPYEGLSETHAAIERWIEANGYRPDGAPWEQYVTDPAEHPNPADWRTEVYWPLAK